MNKPMPVLFVGHGSPMNAIEDNFWSQSWSKIGGSLPRPKAILVASAHWWTKGTQVTAMDAPETIHDFGGFPQDLFEVEYPARGSAELAQRVVSLTQALPTMEWGMDHGTWSFLIHMFPKADVPVVQISLDLEALPADLLALGRKLSPLREEGVLVVGSGSITHNLRDAGRQMMLKTSNVPAWAKAFDEDTARALTARDEKTLALLHATPDGRMAHPTADHWMPLLVAFGATQPQDELNFPLTGFDAGSLSMRTAVWN